MIAKIKIYDAEVVELLKEVDKQARKVDKAKYGLPLDKNNINDFRSVVYSWVHNLKQCK